MPTFIFFAVVVVVFFSPTKIALTAMVALFHSLIHRKVPHSTATTRTTTTATTTTHEFMHKSIQVSCKCFSFFVVWCKNAKELQQQQLQHQEQQQQL